MERVTRSLEFKRRPLPLCAMVALCQITSCLMLSSAGGETPSREAPRATMAEIFALIRIVLPLSASDESFSAAVNREKILRALKELASGA